MLIMMCYFYDDVDDDTVKLVDFGEFAVDGFIDVVDDDIDVVLNGDEYIDNRCLM